jgi:hypothetical protein
MITAVRLMALIGPVVWRWMRRHPWIVVCLIVVGTYVSTLGPWTLHFGPTPPPQPPCFVLGLPGQPPYVRTIPDPSCASGLRLTDHPIVGDNGRYHAPTVRP